MSSRKENRKEKVRGFLADTFELPKEIVLNMPKMVVIGNVSMFVENHKGMVDYDENNVRINTGNGIIGIKGSGLEVIEVTSENMLVRGNFTEIDFDIR